MSDTIVMPDHWRSLLTKAMRLLRQPLYTNAGYLFGITAVGSFTGFLFWGLAARLYDPETVGLASAVISAVTLLTGIAGMGLEDGLVRYLPDAAFPARLLDTVFTLHVLLALLIGGVYLLGLSIWSPSLVALERNLLFASGFLAYAAVMALGMAVRSAFIARRQARYALVHACVVNGVRLPLGALLVSLGAAGLVGSVAFSALVATALSLGVFLPKVELGYQPRPSISRADLFSVLPFALGNYVSVLLTRNVQTVLPLVVLELAGAAPSGYVYIAWMLGTLLVSPGMALATSAFAEGSSAPDELPTILIRAAGLTLALTVPTACLLWVIAPWLLLLFGPNYAQESVRLLRWLAAAAPLAVLSGLYYTYLRVRKQTGLLVAASTFVALIVLTATALGIRHYGIAVTGAGWLVGNALVVLAAVSTIRGKRYDRRD